jgi:hypothetical protein
MGADQSVTDDVATESATQATTDATQVSNHLDKQRAGHAAGQAAMSRIATTSSPQAKLTPAQAQAYMKEVASNMAGSEKPGVLYDEETGLTLDRHSLDTKTGEPIGQAANLSAASKEALDIMILGKALAGDESARTMVSQDGKGDDVQKIALDRLGKKIASYEQFNEAYPGYGGFLPWFQITGEPGHRHMEPVSDWTTRTPSLDNGQLGWAIYYVIPVLTKLGEKDLAAKYQEQFDLMRKNVVKVFYDEEQKALRDEAVPTAGNKTPADKNKYITNPVNPYYLEDGSEGLLMVHFADLFGDWSEHPEGRDALWDKPRQTPQTYTSPQGEKITTAHRSTFTAHEEWTQLMVPERDVPIANDVFTNAQRVRTTDAAENNRPGMYDATHLPTDGKTDEYEDDFGVQAMSPNAKGGDVYAPYGAFPLALVDKEVFATWLKNMTNAPGAMGPTGVDDSIRGDGSAVCPLVSWDNEGMIIVSWMGGITNEVRGDLEHDGLYQRFLETVRREYASFDGQKLEGIQLPLRIPMAGVPRPVADDAKAKP